MREMIPKNVGSRKVGNSRTKPAKDNDYETYERVSKRKTTTTVDGPQYSPATKKPMLSKVMIGGGFIQNKILPLWDSIVVGGSRTPHFLLWRGPGCARTNAVCRKTLPAGCCAGQPWRPGFRPWPGPCCDVYQHQKKRSSRSPLTSWVGFLFC
jgi:hypothetical protein